MRQSQLLITLFLLFAITAPTYARWATPGDLDIETESFKRDIFIRKDGTSTETIELTLIATKESGKDKLISYPLSYTAKSTELKIIEAKTILNNTEYPVDLKDIEDKPLASSPQGFDQKHQILVAFPEIQVNGKIYIKYKITTKEIPVPGFYATDFIFGEDSNWKKSDIHIKSELPLYIESNDTEKVLEIKQKKINHLYQIDINLKKPTIRVPIDEDNIYFDGKLLPWVSISTLQDWSVLGNKMADQYEAILNEPLPPLFETIAMQRLLQWTCLI